MCARVHLAAIDPPRSHSPDETVTFAFVLKRNYLSAGFQKFKVNTLARYVCLLMNNERVMDAFRTAGLTCAQTSRTHRSVEKHAVIFTQHVTYSGNVICSPPVRAEISIQCAVVTL